MGVILGVTFEQSPEQNGRKMRERIWERIFQVKRTSSKGPWQIQTYKCTFPTWIDLGLQAPCSSRKETLGFAGERHRVCPAFSSVLSSWFLLALLAVGQGLLPPYLQSMVFAGHRPSIWSLWNVLSQPVPVYQPLSLLPVLGSMQFALILLFPSAL